MHDVHSDVEQEFVIPRPLESSQRGLFLSSVRVHDRLQQVQIPVSIFIKENRSGMNLDPHFVHELGDLK